MMGLNKTCVHGRNLMGKNTIYLFFHAKINMTIVSVFFMLNEPVHTQNGCDETFASG